MLDSFLQNIVRSFENGLYARRSARDRNAVTAAKWEISAREVRYRTGAV
jgi:hypothetical protein